MTREDVLAELAAGIVDGNFIPFIGAGCSRDLLDGCDWAGITRETARALGVSVADGGPTVAQQYEDRFGRDGLAEFLKGRLTVSAFDPIKGEAHIALMEMRFPRYYTTNIDNAAEACYAAQGREIVVVVKQEDMRQCHAGVPTLLKFHGDISNAASIVWTASDYEERRNERDHFMHVLLRADLLRHSILFIGYSLSPDDVHVRQLLLEMQASYPEAMRGSVMIGYGSGGADYSAFGVRTISVQELYPWLDASQALHQFLIELGATLVGADVDVGLQNLLSASKPSPQAVVSEYALGAAEIACTKQSVSQAVDTFRVTMDAKLIPDVLQDRVVALYSSLCKRVATSAEADDVIGAIFNLHLSQTNHVWVYAEAYALHWATQSFMPMMHLPDIPRGRALLFAMAASILRERKIARNKAFATWVAMNARFGKEVLNDMTEEDRTILIQAFQDIFDGSTCSNPLTVNYREILPQKTADEILKTMLDSLPKTIKRGE